jgi:glutathione synthase/RimK-type ligase-like ATP-grasp enzyme
MRICIITDSASSDASQRFLKESSALDVAITFVKWKDIFFNGETGDVFFDIKSQISIKNFDAVILRSSISSLTPLALLVEYCQLKNIRLLNGDFYLRYQSVNKLRQQMLFSSKNIPCLKTIYGESTPFSYLKKLLGLPFVAKIANGSLGKQVFKICSENEFDLFIKHRQRDHQLYIFQKFYKIPFDYRIFIVGKKVFGPVKRVAKKGEWKTNTIGSHIERAEWSEKIITLANELITKIGLEFGGIDVLIDLKGVARIIEINTMAQFSVFESVFPEINIAKKTINLLKGPQKR